MSGRNGQSTLADQIAYGAEDLDFLSRKVADLSAVLKVLGVAESDDAVDAILDILWKVLDRTMAEGCALTGRASVDGIFVEVMGRMYL